jgi:hypothetical protein
MKLKEKFTEEIFNSSYQVLYPSKFVKIADDYAIEFLEFTEGTYSFGNIAGKWYLHANTSKQYTTKELLEIFKKEKGW